MSLFRSISSSVNTDKLNVKKKTARVPSNVSYLVDNLWEWKRPDNCPNRRYSVYASPSIDLAQQFGGTGDGVVYEVELTGKCLIAQTRIEDARDHPETKTLPKLLLKLLGQDWVDSALKNKNELGQLWIPCLSKGEVDALLQTPSYSHIRESIWENITYWDDATIFNESDKLPKNNGEVFFEPIDGYYLRSINTV